MPAAKRTRSSSKTSKMVKKNNLGRAVRQIVTNMEERKFFIHAPIPTTTYSTSASWTIKNLLVNSAGTGIAQGVDVNQRIGNRIKLDGIDLCIAVTPNPGGMDTTGGVCRIVVWHNKKHTGADPTQGELFVTPPLTNRLITCLQNPVYEERITFHHDFVHSFGYAGTGQASAITSAPEGVYKIHIPAKTVIEYNTTSGAVSSIINESWGLAYVADGGTQCCSLEITAVVRFTDA